MDRSQLFEYKGVIFNSLMINKDSLDIMPDYVIREDDIVIVTYPKSVVFDDFYDHVLGWWKMQEDPRFLFLKYEDMSKDLLKAVTKTKKFLVISLDDVTTASIAEACTFTSLTTAWADSQNKIQRIIGRKGVIGDWKNQFTESQSKAYDAKYRERLGGTGLQFDFE